LGLRLPFEQVGYLHIVFNVAERLIRLPYQRKGSIVLLGRMDETRKEIIARFLEVRIDCVEKL
jgi:hypothetical protein